MPETFAGPTQVRGYHAHVYHDTARRLLRRRSPHNALWLGASVSLRLDILRPTHRTDLLPTA